MSTPLLFDLTPHNLQRPEKIVWTFPLDRDVLETIKSKTTRSFLSNCEQKMNEFGITYKVKTLDRTSFHEWLFYYKKKVTDYNYESLASLEWFDNKTTDGKSVEEIEFKMNGQVVGTELFYVDLEKKRAVAVFKASDRLESFSKKRNSLGAVIDYIFIKTAVSRGVSSISFGRSRNAFGVINPLGNLDYKLRFGMVPNIPKESVFIQSVPVDALGRVSFFATPKGSEKLGLFSAIPKYTDFLFELERFKSKDLSYQLLEY